MKKLSIETRLQAIEAKLRPKKPPIFNLIFECDDIEELTRTVSYCESHNTPVGGIYYSVRWIGSPCAEAEAVAAQYQPDKYKKTIIISHAERIGCE